MPHAGYNTSYHKAVEALQNIEDPAGVSSRCGAEYLGNGFRLDYFGIPCTVTLPECDFSGVELSLGERILILHYLTSDGPLEENPPQATFEGLRGGMFYFPTFKKRGPNRVISDFADDPSVLREIARVSGWSEGSTGDVSIIIPALPRLNLTVVYYEGDDEFPVEVNFLFRKDIMSFLPLEDIAALGGYAATKLLILKNSL